MLANAPTISQVFPSFIEFMGPENENVLVAHNAPFDVGFLKAAAAHLNYPWPNHHVADTARLARYVLTKDDVINCKLATWQSSLEQPLLLLTEHSMMPGPR
jgi:DNA polymerase III epsilon subunit-like protein